MCYISMWRKWPVPKSRGKTCNPQYLIHSAAHVCVHAASSPTGAEVVVAVVGAAALCLGASIFRGYIASTICAPQNATLVAALGVCSEVRR